MSVTILQTPTAYVRYTFKLPESSYPPKVAKGKVAKFESNDDSYDRLEPT